MNITVGQRTLLAKTCKMCGKLKDGSQFCFVAKRYRNSYCNKCKNLHGRPLIQRHQDRASDVAVRARQPWTDQELSKLAAMSAAGLSGPVMALALNRSLYATYTMKNKLNKETA